MGRKQPNMLLRRERELKGWSQQKLAEKLGTNEQAVNRWENGVHKPNRYFQTQLCQIFGKNAEELGFMDETFALHNEELRLIAEDISRQDITTQNIGSSDTVNRREVMKYLSLLGLTLTATSTLSINPASSLDTRIFDTETLSQFKKLTDVCLQLSEGSQLETAERILWSYLPDVEAIAQQSSRYQQATANITSQCYLIAASLVGHHNNLQARHFFSEKALLYGKIAQDYNLQAAALRQIAVTFDYMVRPQKVLQTYQQALPVLHEVSPLLRSCIYAALSGVSAQLQLRQEASRYIGMAFEHFPEKHENEPHYLRLINANYNTLILWSGLNQLELGQPQTANKLLNQLEVFKPTTNIPKRIRAELLIQQARTLVAVKDVEQACAYLELAITLSADIKSNRRMQEAFEIFLSVRQAWPHQKCVQDLGDLFTQHTTYYLQ